MFEFMPTGKSITNPEKPVREDFRCIHQEWRDGKRLRVLMNSEHAFRIEGYTPKEATQAVADVCAGYRDGSIKQSSKDIQLVQSVPMELISQIWVETGICPWQDPETWNDLVLKNPALAAFRTGAKI